MGDMVLTCNDTYPVKILGLEHGCLMGRSILIRLVLVMITYLTSSAGMMIREGVVSLYKYIKLFA